MTETSPTVPNCWACGKPGREVTGGGSIYAQWRCDGCDITWHPNPETVELPDRPATQKWSVNGHYERVRYIDHATRSIPAP